MTTKEEYEFYRDAYEEEIERSRDLSKKSNLYITIISVTSVLLYSSSNILVSAVKINRSIVPTSIVLAIVICLTFFFLIRSLAIANYETTTSLEQYNKELEDDVYLNNDFYDIKIIRYLSATDNNRKINNEKAGFLKWAEFGLFGVVFINFVLLIQILL